MCKLFVGSIICCSATLKIIPPVAINAFHTERYVFLFCLDNSNDSPASSIEWLDPSFQIIPGKYNSYQYYHAYVMQAHHKFNIKFPVEICIAKWCKLYKTAMITYEVI